MIRDSEGVAEAVLQKKVVQKRNDGMTRIHGLKLFLVAILIGTSCTSAFAQRRARDSATVGGVAGAIIGGIIGHQNDEVPEGALIGGAVGALAGGILGNAQEQELQRQRYYQQQAYYQQQQQYYSQQQAAVRQGVSMADVVNMSRSGLSEHLIVNELQSKGIQQRPAVSDIIALHKQGVSENLITAMQQAPLTSARFAQANAPAVRPVTTITQQQVITPSPVVVCEPPVVYRPPVVVEKVYRSYPVHSHHHYYRPSRGATFRIGF